jgi:hypothetical protein
MRVFYEDLHSFIWAPTFSRMNLRTRQTAIRDKDFRSKEVTAYASH